MIQVIKIVKVNGEEHKTKMAFSDNEWALIQKHYPFGGVRFVIKDEKENIVPIKGRAKDDDKPMMKDYNLLKEKANIYFRNEDWSKALYYYQACFKLKSHGWLSGKIAKCKENANG
jgi:hypothetical protein